MENRSSQYDWFKGSNNQNGQKNWKDGAKTTWKFTRIFLFFSVFFFSMWGCVQTFTTKTDTSVGAGTEIFADRYNIAPNVAKVGVYIQKDEKTQDISSIYVKQENSNEYFSGRQEGNEKNFVDMKEQFAARGLINLDDADEGGNTITRLNFFENNMAVDSTKSPYAKDIVNTDKIAVGSTHIGKTDLSPEQQTAIGNVLINDLLSLVKGFTIIPDKDTTKDPKIEVSEEFNKKLETFIKDFKAEQITSWNHVYNISIINSIFSHPDIKAYMLNIKNKDIKDVTVSEAKQMVELVKFITSALVVEDAKKGLSLNNTHFGYLNKGWNPIATWGQAFSMDRGAGPFYGLFVYPLSYVTSKIIESLPFMAGWESFISIVLIVICVSIIIFGLSFKGTLQQTKMQELNAKKAVIEAKYIAYKGNKQMENRKRQEISEMYKKEGVSPLSSLKVVFIQMPLFLAMWRIVGTNQQIKGTTWLGINFAETSYKELFAGQFQYLPLLIIAGGTNILSQIYPKILTRKRDKNRINIHQKQALKKSDKTQNIIMIVFTVMTLIFSAGLQVYFIIRSLWRIFESTITHNIIKKQKQRKIRLRIK